MSRRLSARWEAHLGLAAAVLLAACGPSSPGDQPRTQGSELGAQVLGVSVVGPGGEAISGYRWVLEQDLFYDAQPGVTDASALAVSFHRSYMPVVESGDQGVAPMIDPANAYFLSVVPDTGYTIGGGRIAPGQSSVTIVVNPMPLPTAQITIKVFEDSSPINNAWDNPAEAGLAGFSIVLEEAGGRYGQNGGVQMKDVFGHPLGTTYNVDGSVAVMGDGMIYTGADGTATIRNLSMGKYGVRAIPPMGSSWVQTSTIEGTKTIDCWVKPAEPGYFMEFGPPGFHAEIGFVRPMKDAAVLSGGSTISGKVVNLHLSKPPEPFYTSATPVHTRIWVGLNVGATGGGQGVFAAPADLEGNFTIPDVPPGGYQLVVWDEALDLIFAFLPVTVNGDGSCATANQSCNLGEVPVFLWFTRQEHQVFMDYNGNGFRDDGEPGIPEMNINLRWRDGTIYQAYPTDRDGFVPFDQVFPFFAWQVAEVDYSRFKATGVTITVDDGGPVDPNDPWSFGGQLSPQAQSDNGGLPYRTETDPAPVLLEGFQGFIGQTSVFQWGKQPYAAGENGGIAGIVYYDTTRAENDPRYSAPETWQPGIPGVTVKLWDATGTVLLNQVTTDSWDDRLPTGCQGPKFVHHGVTKDCFDGMMSWNQVRPAVFDGGYIFLSYFPDGFGNGGQEVQGLPPDDYLVEVVPPPGYEIVKEEDKNVDFGDEYQPAPMLLAPECVGPDHVVPSTYSLFPLLDDNGNNVPPKKAGQVTPLCTHKRVTLSDGQNAAADFFLFTQVPIAGHAVGFVLDDTTAEFDPFAPTFGEKYAPPWLPISVLDWTGREVAHTYSDEYGTYNFLVPSSFSANRPAPSGYAPNMFTVCINSPTRSDPANPTQLIEDPHFDPRYSQFCYTFQVMPGTTTYLDTPVIPIAAHSGSGQFPLDCEHGDGTPRLDSVTGSLPGPWVSVANGSQRLTLSAPNAAAGGLVSVPNPDYDGTNAATLLRDFGFGAVPGTVRLGNVTLPIVSWAAGAVVVSVPAGAATGQLSVTRGDNGRSSVNAVTVTVGGAPSSVHALAAGETIQHAIDVAPPGQLILVPKGTYNEIVVMWKPVRLQGAGEGTRINAVKAPAEKLAAWRTLVTQLIDDGSVTLLPGQEVGVDGVEPITLFYEEGPAILVLARDVGPGQGGFGRVGGRPNARVDGFSLTGGDSAGGIVINGYAHYLQVSNNRIYGNGGAYGGGVRSGHPTLTSEAGGALEYTDARNDHLAIQNNHLLMNGGLEGAGGGVSLYTGSHAYAVERNFICGNFSGGSGGGIGHLGLSRDGAIRDNVIAFNESFFQASSVSGGGIAVMGAPPLPGDALSPGSGSVVIDANVVIGNAASAGNGGGIALSLVNGQDVSASANPSNWYRVQIVNTLITNNVAGLAGGGISVQDAVRTQILHDTVYLNDSTGTAAEAFAGGSVDQSTAQPAGIAAWAHSPALAAALPPGFAAYSSPTLTNSIVRHNRSFYFVMDAVSADPPSFGLVPAPADPPVYRDLEVLGAAGSLDPRFCILSDTTGYHASNLAVDPSFVSEYPNGTRGIDPAMREVTTALQPLLAYDEGGNWIRVRFGPLTLWNAATSSLLGNYHLRPGSPAIDAGTTLLLPAVLRFDVDGQPRPSVPGGVSDIGADEWQ